MGVSREDYIVYGWKLPYDFKDSEGNKIDFLDDKYLPYIEWHEGVEYTIISDGMCGDYNVFGLLVKNCTDNGDGWDFEELNIEDFDSNKVISKYKELLNNDPEEYPKLFIFSHYY